MEELTTFVNQDQLELSNSQQDANQIDSFHFESQWLSQRSSYPIGSLEIYLLNPYKFYDVTTSSRIFRTIITPRTSKLISIFKLSTMSNQVVNTAN